MLSRNFFIIASCVSIAACGSAGKFSRALDEPVKMANGASAIAALAERDRIKAIALGNPKANLADLVCNRSSGPLTVESNLGVFGDALDTIQKVAEKPDDTSYAGYLRSFRKNAENINSEPEPIEIIRKKMREKQVKLYQRCIGQFNQDMAANNLYVPAIKGGSSAAVATFLSLDKLVKLTLKYIEEAQREKAVRSTITEILPQLREAYQQLSIKEDQAFGLRVQYQPSDNVDHTSLGEVVNIHRWYVAKEISGIWQELNGCRVSVQLSCLNKAEIRTGVNYFAESVINYRSLASVDSGKVLAALDESIKKIEEADQGKASLAEVVDGLVALADAMSGLDGAYKEYDKTKDED
ncbi:hypothetical protein [Pseudomonas sp. BF-RE-24]|uniref:hypothetical protein n=1 Tax=Pseudomonas sp. BF-RE-24 TaxID=2832381 RepID=UPI001CC17DD4|nr:hypothetical protein [Pseudomonas sp. BF-RE-24]